MRYRAGGRYITGALAALLILLASPVRADGPKCFKRSDIAKEAMEQFRESPYATMTTNTGLPLELWVSPDGKTFTLFVAPAPDVLCVIGDGTDFKVIGSLGQGA